LAERIGPGAPQTWTSIKLAVLSYFVSPVKVSDSKDRLLSLYQKSAEGISKYVTEFQRLLILHQISNETDKVYAFFAGFGADRWICTYAQAKYVSGSYQAIIRV
jgi:Retrotransposon gag protein